MSLPRSRPVAVAVALAVAGLLGAAACGSSATVDTPEGAAPTSAGDPAGTPVPATAPRTTPPGTDPGNLPQTDEKPATSGAQWDAGTKALWQAIVDDDPKQALPFFFPLSAYKQVKAISDPAKDYDNRLIAYYEQDIHALHKQLGTNAAKATFARLEVPATAQWIKPGVEYNKGAYWRVFDSKLVYTVDGKEKSFPVKSMISWRGQWYVVHLSSIR